MTRKPFVAAAAFALLTSCGWSTGGSPPLGSHQTTNDGSSSASPHVMVIVEENHSSESIIRNPELPYINSLAQQYGSATKWAGVAHPSLPNYLAMISGSTWNSTSDSTPAKATYPGPTLADELASKNVGWKAYMEDMPHRCDTTDTYGPNGYDVNHNPFVYFRSITGTASQCNRIVPFDEFAADLKSGQAPSFIWVSPNLRHDMHDGTYMEADQWLKSQLQVVLGSQWYADKGVVILTWDEGDSASDRIPTIVISRDVAPGSILESSGNHYGTLRALAELYGLKQLGGAAKRDNNDLLPLTRLAAAPSP